MLGTYTGVDGTLEILDDRLAFVHAGMLTFLTEKKARNVPYATIEAVALQPRVLVGPGVLRVVLTGGKPGLFDSVAKEEVLFSYTDLGIGASADAANTTMTRVKAFIEEKVRATAQRRGTGEAGLADEILKLALLVEQGILSPDEFQTAKRRLLGSG